MHQKVSTPLCCVSFMRESGFSYTKWLEAIKPLFTVQRHWDNLDIHVGVILIGNTFSPHKWCSNFEDWLGILVPTSVQASVTQPCFASSLSLGKQSDSCVIVAQRDKRSCQSDVNQNHPLITNFIKGIICLQNICRKQNKGSIEMKILSAIFSGVFCDSNI